MFPKINISTLKQLAVGPFLTWSACVTYELQQFQICMRKIPNFLFFLNFYFSNECQFLNNHNLQNRHFKPIFVDKLIIWTIKNHTTFSDDYLLIEVGWFGFTALQHFIGYIAPVSVGNVSMSARAGLVGSYHLASSNSGWVLPPSHWGCIIWTGCVSRQDMDSLDANITGMTTRPITKLAQHTV